MAGERNIDLFGFSFIACPSSVYFWQAENCSEQHIVEVNGFSLFADPPMQVVFLPQSYEDWGQPFALVAYPRGIWYFLLDAVNNEVDVFGTAWAVPDDYTVLNSICFLSATLSSVSLMLPDQDNYLLDGKVAICASSTQEDTTSLYVLDLTISASGFDWTENEIYRLSYIPSLCSLSCFDIDMDGFEDIIVSLGGEDVFIRQDTDYTTWRTDWIPYSFLLGIDYSSSIAPYIDTRHIVSSRMHLQTLVILL